MPYSSHFNTNSWVRTRDQAFAKYFRYVLLIN